MLKPLPVDSFDSRDIVPCVVGRKSTICYETNRYSAPPEFIATMVLLYVHPLTREAELVADGRSVRVFPLAAAGTHALFIFEEDRKEFAVRWAHDRSRLAIRRAPRRRRVEVPVDVAVRSPAVYDIYAGIEEVGA